MTNPFRFCPINYDMTCGHLPNYFNLQANMYMADTMARANLYNVPIMNFGTFMPYGGVSIPGDAIFNYTLNQANYQSLQMGGNGIFGINGTLNLTGNIFGGGYAGGAVGGVANPFASPWANPTPGSSSSSSSSSSGKTDAEIKAGKKLEREERILRKLLVDYIDINKDINQDLRDTIDTALIKRGSKEEKYNALKEAFKQIDTADLRKVFPNLNDYRVQLVAAGYDFENSDCYEYDDANIELVEKAREAIEELKKQEGNIIYSQEAGLTNLTTVNFTEENVLELISLWNENETSKRFILEIKEVVEKIESVGEGPSNSKVSATKALLGSMIDALQTKANPQKLDIPRGDTAREELEDLKNALTDAKTDVFANPTTASWEELSNAFDDLYTFLRKQEAKRINKEISEKYSFLNDIKQDTITSDLIIADTEEDLISENISDTHIERNLNDNNEADLQTNINSLINSKVIESKEIGDTTYYQETKNTGERNYKRVFVVKDNKLQEIDGARIVDDAIVDKDGNPITEPKYTERTTSSVASEYKNTKRAEEKSQHTEATQVDMKERGQEVWRLLKGKTNNAADRTINSYIKKEEITKETVYDFLSGVYNSERYNNPVERFFEKLNDDTDVAYETSKNILDKILLVAEDLGLQNSSNYAGIKQCLKIMTDNNINDFSKKRSGWFMDWESYSERIDKYLEPLFREIEAIKNA